MDVIFRFSVLFFIIYDSFPNPDAHMQTIEQGNHYTFYEKEGRYNLQTISPVGFKYS